MDNKDGVTELQAHHYMRMGYNRCANDIITYLDKRCDNIQHKIIEEARGYLLECPHEGEYRIVSEIINDVTDIIEDKLKKIKDENNVDVVECKRNV